jgi:3-oxoacyl-[acyl-carrier-protein] synthase II
MIAGARISGIGHLSALGQGKTALEQALAGARLPQLVFKNVVTARGVVEVPVYQAPEVVLPPEVPESVRRRMPRISRMFHATMLDAMADAFGPGAPLPDPERIGLVVGTGLGCLEAANTFHRRVILEGAAGSSPTLFANSVQNAMAAHLSISCGLRGPTCTVTTMEQSTFGAFRVAVDWIGNDSADHVVLAIGDELIDFNAYVVAHKPEIPRELSPRVPGCTVVAGEGVAVFILSRDGTLGKSGTCRIEDVQLCPERCPDVPRVSVAAFGAAGQWARYQRWIGRPGDEIDCHAQFFGSFVTGSAIETAIAALRVSRDGLRTACVQLTDRGEAQAIVLGP